MSTLKTAQYSEAYVVDQERTIAGLSAEREQVRKAIGHAFHLIEHNKVMCHRCREAKARLQAALTVLETKP